MSYILDALKKADRDRSLGEVPDLEAAHWGVRRDGGPRRWLWIVAVLLILNAALLVWMLGRNSDRDAVPQEVVEWSRPHVAETASPAAVVEPAAVEPALTPDKPDVAPEQTAVTPQQPEDEPAGTLTVRRPKVAVRPHVTPPGEQAGAGSAPAPRVVQAPVPLAETVAAAGAELPELSELPLEFRGDFQAPRIDVHVYAEQPQRRFILVDLQKFREGDTLQSGAVLEKIHPNSIQLFYQGRRFRVDR